MTMRAAFTLIEALVAILLVAVVVPIGLEAVTRAGQAAGQTRRQDRALQLAQSKLAYLTATGEWQTSAQSGAFAATVDGEDAEGLRWELASTPWRDETVTELRLTVSWDPPSPHRQVSLTTLATPPVNSTP